MSIYPHITTLSEFKRHVEHLPEIRFDVQENGYTVCCYMIADKDTFNTSHARECRGITFDREGNIASRSMEKFFNVGENISTQPQTLTWADVTRMMDKRDGSVVNSVVVDDKIVFKSKKSFVSHIAEMANERATLNHKIMCRELHDGGYTPTFELTSPQARIVLKYPDFQLTLLHVRHNNTGEYFQRHQLEHLALHHDVPLVEEFHFPGYDVMKGELETLEGREGYVIQFQDGLMVKAKSKWYLERHHCMTALTERNVAEMVIAEGLDDIKSRISEMGEPDLLDKVENIEKVIKHKIMLLTEYTETALQLDGHLPRKDFAIKYSKYAQFGLMMDKYLGKEPKYLDFYAKHYLKDDWKVLSL